MKKYECVGSGLLTLDHLFILNEFPCSNRKYDVATVWQQPGGPVPVGLMTMHQLGVNSCLLSDPGSGTAREKIQSYWRQIGFSTEMIFDTNRNPVPEAFIWVGRKDGSRTVFSVNSGFGEPDLSDSELLAVCENTLWIYLDGRTEFQRRLKAAAISAGCRVFIDLGDRREQFSELVRGTEVVIGSADFAKRQFPGVPAEAVLTEMNRSGVTIAGLTLGDKGSVFYDGRKMVQVPALPVSVSDSTGAGDIFHGAFLAAFLRGFELEEAAQFATRTAAWSLKHPGHRLHELPRRFKNELLLNR